MSLYEFQNSVLRWANTCFAPSIVRSKTERSQRFIEEAIELVQACGCSVAEVHAAVDYVFGRPIGAKEQEVGGVMVTLALLCTQQGLDLEIAARDELWRILDPKVIEKIRAKQLLKPKFAGVGA